MKNEKQIRKINRKKKQLEFIKFAQLQKLNFIEVQIGLLKIKG